MYACVCVCMCKHIIHTHRLTYKCIHAKSLQLCLTLCDSIDCSLPGSSVHGILEWVAMPSSKGSSQPRDRTHVYTYIYM